MEISSRGIQLIKEFEGAHVKLPDGRYKAYLDRLAEPDVPTIYTGLTKGVRMGMVITEDDGERMFTRELAVYDDAVDRLVKVPLNQNQHDALVSFCYNCGVGALERSTLRRLLNKGRYDQVPAQLLRWNKAGGKVWNGLIRRRKAEGSLFMEPVPEDYIPESSIINDGVENVEIDTPMTKSVEEGSFKELVDAHGLGHMFDDEILKVGDQGDMVKLVQQRLRDLRYAVGTADGIFGPRTKAAVLAFQDLNELSMVDGVVGPETLDALNKADAISMPLGDRASDTMEGLRGKGSKTIEKADKAAMVTKTVGVVGALGGLVQAADALTGASELLKDLNTLKTLTSGFVSIWQFASDQWWLIALFVAFIIYRYVDDVRQERLEDHQNGQNLSR